jgi:hypothetical protein
VIKESRPCVVLGPKRPWPRTAVGIAQEPVPQSDEVTVSESSGASCGCAGRLQRESPPAEAHLRDESLASSLDPGDLIEG